MFTNQPTHYEDSLAAYACKSSCSIGRKYKEMPHPFRNPFQRDRDRIVHTKAFRRLEYKTQVLINSLGDHYRTRLTHTIEVSLVSRSIARVLGLHEDLTEAIALAHDLGHPPFGHAGEGILNKIMKEHNGFEHNIQSFRNVDVLENPYPQFKGLNLTFEVRRSLLKKTPTSILTELFPGFKGKIPAPPLEAKVVDMADEITYTAHDLEDALNYNFLNLDQIRGVEIIDIIKNELPFNKNGLGKLVHHNLSRSLLDYMVKDLVSTSLRLIEEKRITSYEGALKNSDLITLSRKNNLRFLELKEFLNKEFYHNKNIEVMFSEADRILQDLFKYYCKNLSYLPKDTAEKDLQRSPERIVCDYLAGMTDRFILDDYQRIFQ